MTSILRLEDISIHNYIKYEVLAQEFVENIMYTNVLYVNGKYIPDVSSNVLDPFSRGRGIVVFDDSLVDGRYVVDTTQEQSVKEHVESVSSYTINYITGEIVNPSSEPELISFAYYYVSVLDAWPGKNPPPLPIVSIDITATNPSGLQLGGGKIHTRSLSLDVFATNRAERDEITEFLVDGLYNRTITVKDYSQGNYLNYDGTYNSSFDHTPVATSPIYIANVSARFLGTDVSWDEMNKYRSRIDVYYESISES